MGLDEQHMCSSSTRSPSRWDRSERLCHLSVAGYTRPVRGCFCRALGNVRVTAGFFTSHISFVTREARDEQGKRLPR